MLKQRVDKGGNDGAFGDNKQHANQNQNYQDGRHPVVLSSFHELQQIREEFDH